MLVLVGFFEALFNQICFKKRPSIDISAVILKADSALTIYPIPRSCKMAVAFPVEYLVAIAVAVFTFIALIVHSTKGDRRSQLVGAKKACRELIDKSNCGPILVRLAWHDSGEFSG
jgi:hypothetical protein